MGLLTKFESVLYNFVIEAFLKYHYKSFLGSKSKNTSSSKYEIYEISSGKKREEFQNKEKIKEEFHEENGNNFNKFIVPLKPEIKSNESKLIKTNKNFVYFSGIAIKTEFLLIILIHVSFSILTIVLTYKL